MLVVVLIVCTIIGGLAGILWVDLEYPKDSGLQAKLEEGYEISWPLEDRVERKKLDGWEVVVLNVEGKPHILKVRSYPSNHVLMKKRL